ncbi:MAG: FecR domain-containing protein [Polyangiaceae bacterium]
MRLSVLASLQRRQLRRKRTTVATAVGGTLIVGGLVLGRVFLPASGQAITFRVLPGNDLGQVGAYVAPTANAPLDLKFAEGSVVELEPGARARVSATTARGATVLLETGRADVNVVHRKNADWTVMAGPYSVRVHGTAFTVEFDPRSQLFELVMRSGVVTVEGPGISKPVEIRGAQRFVHRAGLGLDPADTTSTVQPKVAEPPTTAELPSRSASANAPISRSESLGKASGKPSGSAAPAMSVGTSPALTWEAQVRRGEYAAVLRDAETRGISTVLASANSVDLLALANAARFSGRVDVGRDAYKAIRQRFAGSSTSVLAAFLLGRLTEGSSVSEARRWYERYEQEAPSGALVAEAMGRRMVLTQTAGSRAEVQRMAEEYLRRFPDGPYAGVARKIVAP